MGKRKKRRAFVPRETELKLVPQISERFEEVSGQVYEDVPEEVFQRVSTSLFLQQREYFQGAEDGSSNMRLYVYGESQKHCSENYYTLVVKRGRGFEHTYYSYKKGQEILREVEAMGIQTNPDA